MLGEYCIIAIENLIRAINASAMLQAEVFSSELHTNGSFLATGALHLPKGNHATARLHRDWLRNLPGVTGLPLTKIAQESKIAPSTLTRPAKEGDDGISTLHADTIAKVVNRFGVAPPAGVVAPLPGGRHAPSGLVQEASLFQPEPDDPLAAALKALIGSRNTLAPWLMHSRALELAGIMPGDIVIVDLNGTPKPGDAVYAEVYDFKRNRAEVVMRVFERASPVTLLLPRTLDPGLQEPLVVDGERVVVKGVLLPSRLRKDTPTAA